MVAGPVYINAIDHMVAVQLAYEALPVLKDSDLIRVWTLAEFKQKARPADYAASDVKFNQPILPRGLPPIMTEVMEFNQQLGDLPSTNREKQGTDDTRTCFNCNLGTMRHLIESPGWYCSDCGMFLPDDQVDEEETMDCTEIEVCPQCGNENPKLFGLYNFYFGDSLIVCGLCGEHLSPFEYTALADLLYEYNDDQANWPA